MALAVTRTVAPVSARMAGQRPVIPRTVVTRNTALSPRAIAMFWRMLLMVRRERFTMAGTSTTRPWRTAASAVSYQIPLTGTCRCGHQAPCISRPT